jgi:hypothetical protein
MSKNISRRDLFKFAMVGLSVHVVGLKDARAQFIVDQPVIVPDDNVLLHGHSECRIVRDMRSAGLDRLVCSSEIAILFKHQHIIEIPIYKILNPPQEGLDLKTSWNQTGPRHWHSLTIASHELRSLGQGSEVDIRDRLVYGEVPVHEHIFRLKLPSDFNLSDYK